MNRRKAIATLIGVPVALALPGVGPAEAAGVATPCKTFLFHAGQWFQCRFTDLRVGDLCASENFGFGWNLAKVLEEARPELDAKGNRTFRINIELDPAKRLDPETLTVGETPMLGVCTCCGTNPCEKPKSPEPFLAGGLTLP